MAGTVNFTFVKFNCIGTMSPVGLNINIKYVFCPFHRVNIRVYATDLRCFLSINKGFIWINDGFLSINKRFLSTTKGFLSINKGFLS